MTDTPTTAPIATPAMAPLVSPPLPLEVDSGGAVGLPVGAERGATPEAGLASVVASDKAEDEI